MLSHSLVEALPSPVKIALCSAGPGIGLGFIQLASVISGLLHLPKIFGEKAR
jgi:hypothetical protein